MGFECPLVVEFSVAASSLEQTSEEALMEEGTDAWETGR
jgi:hypothetical protein